MKITSHRHGHGKYAREAWGSREDCKQCSAQDAAFEAARQHYAERLRQSETLKAEELKVDADGLITGEFA